VCRSSDTNSKKDLERLKTLVFKGLNDVQKEQIHIGTTHSYKGGQADLVCVLDAVENRFPMTHPDWIFGRIFGDNEMKLEEEERRLFYVACSRAKSRLVIITEQHRESPYVKNLNGICEKLDWNNLKPFCPAGGDWIIQIGNHDGYDNSPTKERSNALKADGYSFSGGARPHWRKRIDRNHTLEMIVEGLPQKNWYTGPDGIEISIYTSDGLLAKSLITQDGELQPLT